MRKIEKEFLSEKAYRLIKNKVSFSNDQHLSIRKISKELNMGYSPIREACQRLHQEGLLKGLPGVGYFIPQVEIKSIIEIFEVRKFVEKHVFEEVFDSLTEEHLTALSGYITKEINSLKQQDIRGFRKYDKKFHMLFFKIYNNSVLLNLMKNVMDKYYICSYKTLNSINKKGSADAIEEHEKIINCIKQKNKQEATIELTKHIHNSEERIKQGYYHR
ncbi:MAG: GntR family transcriptional regulator [Atribacterota bacterium]